MYLHIGKNVMIPYQDIIVIGDLESLKESKGTKEFFQYLKENNSVNKQKEGEQDYRSVIVTAKGTHFSIISSNTLKERMKRKHM